MRSGKDYREVMLDENKPLAGREAFYSLNNKDSAARFINRVTRLFYGENVEKQSFFIYGRTVTIPKAANGKAIFTFEELCGNNDNNPFGPADYLELCRRYHTIVVQSIPILGLAQKNEARRLITFIDAVYENKGQVIISSDADGPEGLFVISKALKTGERVDEEEEEQMLTKDEAMHREMLGDLYGGMIKTNGEGKGSLEFVKVAIFTGEEERFAFKRAVSRLREMSSDIYRKTKHRPVPLDWSGLKGVRGTPGATEGGAIVEDSEKVASNTTLAEEIEEDFKAFAIVGADAPRGLPYGPADKTSKAATSSRKVTNHLDLIPAIPSKKTNRSSESIDQGVKDDDFAQGEGWVRYGGLFCFHLIFLK